MATFYQYDPDESNRYVAKVEMSHQPLNSTTAAPPHFGDSRPFYWTGSSWSEVPKAEEPISEKFYPDDNVVFNSDLDNSQISEQKIYHYDPKTKIFTGEDFADKSPLEPGKFLIPAHSTISPPPPLEDGKVAVFDGSKWIISEKTDEDVEVSEEDPWEIVRLLRNKKLKESDWTQLLDSPLSDADRLTWAEYRARLRSIPQDFSSPQEIIWPKKP
jgi:hypothetical protein